MRRWDTTWRLLQPAALASIVLLAPPAVARPPAADAAPSLRACCYLGHDIETRLGPLATPVHVLGVGAAGGIGHHTYANRSLFDERNGLIYSCRGGIIDVGHVRNAADWAGHLIRLLDGRLGRGESVSLGWEAGPMHLELTARDVDDYSADERRDTVAAIAVRLAFDLALWNELLQWHDIERVRIYPELYSAFSPEDLYSDLLGAIMGAWVARSDTDFDAGMDVAMAATLETLRAQSAAVTRTSLDRAAGRWWDPAVPLPDRNLLRRRYIDIGPILRPWRVTGVSGCEQTDSVPLAVPDIDARGQRLAPWYRLVFDVSNDARRRLLPGAPETLSDRDLPRMVAHAREQILAATGANSLAWPETGDGPPVEPGPQGDDIAGRWAAERQLPAGEYQGLRVLPLSAFGGARRLRDPRATGGATITGAEADTSGGDLTVVRYQAAWDPGRRGLISHVTGIQARSLYPCRDRTTGDFHIPVAAWFQDCDGAGWWGLGLTLLQLQHDGETGRSIVRPAEIDLAVNLTGNAGSSDYVRRHLVLNAGFGIDSFTPGRGSPASQRAEVSPRLVLGLRGRWRSEELRWELEGSGSLQQDVAERRDYGMEAAVAVRHRVVIRGADASGGPGPMEGIVLIGAEAGWAWWERPHLSISDGTLPLLSDRAPRSLYVLLTLRLSYEGLTF